MEPPNCLLDPSVIAVLDTSAVINLNATGRADGILRALPNRAVVVEAVMEELEQGRLRGRENAELTRKLVLAGLVEIVKLGPAGGIHLEELAIGKAADTLDDGEAATIAHALESGAVPIIDERKAHRICGERYTDLVAGCTIDLFSHPAVEEQLGRDALSAAVLQALTIARMSVLPKRAGWVVDLIGRDRAATCTSLPRIARRAAE